MEFICVWGKSTTKECLVSHSEVFSFLFQLSLAKFRISIWIIVWWSLFTLFFTALTQLLHCCYLVATQLSPSCYLLATYLLFSCFPLLGYSVGTFSKIGPTLIYDDAFVHPITYISPTNSFTPRIFYFWNNIPSISPLSVWALKSVIFLGTLWYNKYILKKVFNI